MIEAGLFDCVKAIEIIGGLMLITGRFTPLALAMLVPVSAIVFYNGGIISGGLDRLFYMGTHAFYLNIILILAYIRYYLPMMAYHSDLGTLDDLKKLSTIFKPEARNPKLPS